MSRGVLAVASGGLVVEDCFNEEPGRTNGFRVAPYRPNVGFRGECILVVRFYPYLLLLRLLFLSQPPPVTMACRTVSTNRRRPRYATGIIPSTAVPRRVFPGFSGDLRDNRTTGARGRLNSARTGRGNSLRPRRRIRRSVWPEPSPPPLKIVE